MSEESAFPGAHFCSNPSAPASRLGLGSDEVGLPNPSQRNSQIASLIIFKGSFGAGTLTFISPPTLSFLQALLTPFASRSTPLLNLKIIDTIGCNESFRNCYDLRWQSPHLIRRLLTSTGGSMVSSCTWSFHTLQQPTQQLGPGLGLKVWQHLSAHQVVERRVSVSTPAPAQAGLYFLPGSLSVSGLDQVNLKIFKV